MKKYLIIAILLFSQAHAQDRKFISEGIIEFEKTVNMYGIIKKSINNSNRAEMSRLLDQFKATKPQFETFRSTLVFNTTRSLFTPAPTDTDVGLDIPMIYQHNIVYSDLQTKANITQKKVYEQLFLVRDTTRNIKWKLTSETRVIAGYPCRRANAVIMDSVYVVAFYSINIPVSSGPESFSGLPGMILGLALPHENVTWFATMVTPRSVQPAELIVPSKGWATNKSTLGETLYSALKYWGEYANIAMKAFLL